MGNATKMTCVLCDRKFSRSARSVTVCGQCHRAFETGKRQAHTGATNNCRASRAVCIAARQLEVERMFAPAAVITLPTTWDGYPQGFADMIREARR